MWRRDALYTQSIHVAYMIRLILTHSLGLKESAAIQQLYWLESKAGYLLRTSDAWIVIWGERNTMRVCSRVLW